MPYKRYIWRNPAWWKSEFWKLFYIQKIWKTKEIKNADFSIWDSSCENVWGEMWDRYGSNSFKIVNNCRICIRLHRCWWQEDVGGLCWWQFSGVGDRISILMTSFWCWCPTLMLKDRECWWQNQPNPSPISLSCRQHISSPIYVTNIDVAT